MFRGGGAQGANNLASINHLGQHLAVAYVVASDQRLKSNIQPLPYGLQTLLQMQPVQYNQTISLQMKNGQLIPNTAAAESLPSIGMLAQQLHGLVPEAVLKPTDESNDLWGVDYQKLIPILIKAIQEQQEQINQLQKEMLTRRGAEK